MKVISENDTNWLVVQDGQTVSKTKSSSLNQLIYGHNLAGLLDTGDEIWTGGGGGEPNVTVVPDDDAVCYTLSVNDRPPLELGAHHKTDLVDAFEKVYQQNDGDSVEPLVKLYENIRESMKRAKLLDPFAPLLGDSVEIREGRGWFINGHLLLTYEGDFYHSEHTSRDRSGSVVGEGTAVEAYQQAVPEPDGSISRQVTVEGKEYRLTNGEVEFITKAMWAVQATPDRRNQ